MNLNYPALATVFLLTSGCALTEPDKAPTAQNDHAAVAGAAAGSGAPAPKMQQAPAGRTRAEVHAEAVEAAKHHKSTIEEQLDYFMH